MPIRNPELSPTEVIDWLRAFDSDPARAMHECPNVVYAELRNYGHLDADHRLSEHARSYL